VYDGRCHSLSRIERALLFAIAFAFLHCEVLARGNLSGRYFITFQTLRDPSAKFERLDQHFEARLRDVVANDHRVGLTFYFDNSDDLIDDFTFRSYRAQLDARHLSYTFEARVTPRQKITPLELQASREVANNQFSLLLHHRNLPRLRLTYGDRSGYEIGQRTSKARDLRAELSHRMRGLEFKVNRWNSTVENTGRRETDVTGAMVRANRPLGRSVHVNGGYEFQLTETAQNGVQTNDVTNHVANAGISGQYGYLLRAAANGTIRRLRTEGFTQAKSDNDNFVGRLMVFPTRPYTFQVSRTYLATETNIQRTKADYATVEMLLRGPIGRGSFGRVQVAKRYDINTQGGIVPANTFLAALRTNVYDGVDFRIDVNLAQRQDVGPFVPEYSMTSIAELFLRPRRSLFISPNMQVIASSARFTALRNDRVRLGVRSNYVAPRRWTFGCDLNATDIRTGLARRRDYSALFNFSTPLRGRSSLNATYAINDTRPLDGSDTAVALVGRRSNTFNVNAQVWIMRRGSLAFNYGYIDREVFGETENFSASFRIDF
jgi:hypothetical protein